MDASSLKNEIMYSSGDNRVLALAHDVAFPSSPTVARNGKQDKITTTTHVWSAVDLDYTP